MCAHCALHAGAQRRRASAGGRSLGTKRDRRDRMKRWLRAGGIFAAVSCTAALSAFARADEEQRPGYFAQSVRAPATALELAVENHYSQGVGLAAQGVRATDLTREGIGFGVTTGYRLS